MIARLIILLVRFISGARAFWQGCSPQTHQRIYFANHTSNLDAVVLWAALPPEVRAITRPVAALDYWTANRPRYFLATRVLKAILIDRKKVTAHNNPLVALLAALAEGASLIIFPEGGRGRSAEPGAFKSGLFHLALKRPDVELIPVYIDNMNRILPKGEFLPVPLLSSIFFGAPLRPVEPETKEAFLTHARDAVIALRPK